MFELYSVIPLIGVCLGVFSCIIILLKQQQPIYRKTLFLVFILSISYYSFTIFMVNSDQLINWPHVFRTGSPFFYMISVSLFLLSRAFINDQKKPELLDIVLLSIPILHIIELLPFYLKSSSEKIIIIESFIQNKGSIYTTDTSFISTNFHYTLQGFFGILSGGTVVFNTTRLAVKEKVSVFKFRWSWLFFIGLSVFILFLIAIFAYVFLKLDRFFFQYFMSVYFASTLLLILLLIFLHPNVLYAFDVLKIPTIGNNNINKSKTLNLEDKEIDAVKSKIETFFKNNHDYLSSEFRLQDFADDLKMNKNFLSQVINTVYNQNFNQLVNSKRIDYVLEKLKDVQWAKLSFEGMANTVGFKSRTTFNKAFKEKTNLTPSEYILKIRN